MKPNGCSWDACNSAPVPMAASGRVTYETTYSARRGYCSLIRFVFSRDGEVIMNLGHSLHSHSQRNPQKTALFCGDEEMSYGTLDESTTALASWFVGQGLQPGDRVGVHWTNSIQTVQLVYASFKAGLTAVTINTRLKPAEIGYILNHSEAKICFSEPELTPLAKQAHGKCAVLSTLPMFRTADVDRVPLPTGELDRPAVLLYTSGTTARPKGVTHTHRTFIEVSAILEQRRVKLGVGDDERYLCVTPMMHAAALFGVTTEINLGRSVVLLPKFDPAAVLNAIEQFQCSRLTCMPTLWQFIVAEQERSPRSISSLSVAFAAGDAVPVTLQERFRAVFGIPLTGGLRLDRVARHDESRQCHQARLYGDSSERG
jgi:long-chain acyl-CoA synthetase